MKNLEQIMIISEGVKTETTAILMDIWMWPQRIISDILWNKLEVYLNLEKEILIRGTDMGIWGKYVLWLFKSQIIKFTI